VNGDKAEELFRALTGASKAGSASDGDAVLQGHLVEIKQTSSTQRITLNQVRAAKYLPIVVHNTTTGEWFVIPAHEVVEMVSAKTRGQHTSNPYESAALSFGIDGLRKWKVYQEDVGPAVMRAIAVSGSRSVLSDLMVKINSECRAMAHNHKCRVQRALIQDRASRVNF
jgi:hypothetical protein